MEELRRRSLNAGGGERPVRRPEIHVRQIAANAPNWLRKIGSVRLLGDGKLKFTRDENGLQVALPEKFAAKIAFALKIKS